MRDSSLTGLRRTNGSNVEERCVFVVEDDSSMRNALNNLLRSAGFEPKLFRSAEEFLNAEHPNSASCVVLDVRLPGMNGLELQKVLIARNIFIPIIFITAHGDIPMSLRALEAG